jgi:hypothetical protein
MPIAYAVNPASRQANADTSQKYRCFHPPGVHTGIEIQISLRELTSCVPDGLLPFGRRAPPSAGDDVTK